MAGRGPAPKTNRQRRNQPLRGEWTRLEPMAEPVLPELDEFEPPSEAGAIWPAHTRLLWDAWRDDPVTQTWNASDRAFAVDTIVLHAVAGTAKPNELRLRMESLGLTPKGRRDLRFLLPEETEPEAPDAAQSSTPAPRTRPAAV